MRGHCKLSALERKQPSALWLGVFKIRGVINATTHAIFILGAAIDVHLSDRPAIKEISTHNSVHSVQKTELLASDYLFTKVANYFVPSSTIEGLHFLELQYFSAEVAII